MTWSEIILACWKMYPAQCIALAVLVPLCGGLLGAILFCLFWNKLQ